MKLFDRKYVYADREIEYCLLGKIKWRKHANHLEIGEGTREAWASVEQNHLEAFRHCDVVAEIRPGDLCIDCGANVGDITGVFLEHGAEVHAFEPNPVAFTRLEERFGERVLLHNAGVFNNAGTMKLFLSDFNDVDAMFFSQSSSIYSTKDNVNPESFIEIDLVDLSKYITCLGRRIRILKLDIEGAEFAVLDKMLDTGAYCLCDHILVEAHDDGSIPEIMGLARKVRARVKDLHVENINLNWI